MHLIFPGTYAAFVAVSLAVVVAPGPDTLGVLSYGASRGRAAGIGYALGCALGCLTHTTWAAIGVAALIAASATAFSVLKCAGGIYLCYLGVKALRSSGERLTGVEQADEAPFRSYVARGFLSNALNPKVALFFLAFLPQFAGHAAGARWQMVLLGATFAALTAIVFCSLGYFAGAVGAWLQRRPDTTKWLDRATGSLFIALGIRLALAQSRH
jgi:threonine/homoserine/homoserine lactone efflux protein